MTFCDAIRLSEWVRRHGRPAWVYVRRDAPLERMFAGAVGYLTWRDLVADDWEIHTEGEQPKDEPDGSSQRFALLELNDDPLPR